MTVPPPGTIDHRGLSSLPAVSPEEAARALARSATNGRTDYSIAFAALVQATDACSRLVPDGCEGCPGRSACAAAWDEWVERDAGDSLGRLLRRLDALEQNPGCRMPRGTLRSWVVGTSPLPEANPPPESR